MSRHATGDDRTMEMAKGNLYKHFVEISFALSSLSKSEHRWILELASKFFYWEKFQTMSQQFDQNNCTRCIFVSFLRKINRKTYMAHKNSKYCQRTEKERLKRPLNMFFARVPIQVHNLQCDCAEQRKKSSDDLRKRWENEPLEPLCRY